MAKEQEYYKRNGKAWERRGFSSSAIRMCVYVCARREVFAHSAGSYRCELEVFEACARVLVRVESKYETLMGVLALFWK